MDDIWGYYGVDWIAMALSLLAVYLLGQQRKIGFIIFIVSNLMWAFLGFTWMNSLGIAIGNIIFAMINAKGYYNWIKKEQLPEA